MPRLLGSILLNAAERWPASVAVVDGAVELTYGQFAGRVSAFAGHLRYHGIVPGDRVVLLLSNRVEFLLAHFGVLAAGAISVPLAPESSPARVAFCVNDVDARAIIAQPPWDTVIQGLERTPNVIVSTTAWPVDGQAVNGVERSPADPAVLMYTTGTSGQPKAVVLSHRNTLTALDNMRNFIRPERERELLALPLSHSFGLGQAYLTLLTGGSVILHDGLKRMKTLLASFAQNRITSFASTPTGYQLLFDRAGGAFTAAARDLRLSVVNSSPMPPALTQRVRRELPDVRLITYYGLTEASRTTFHDLSAPGADIATVGRAPQGIDVAVIDENGAPVTAGSKGEIVVRGATVADGYWNRPHESAEAFRDGALLTGDVGYLDERGQLFITGRLKEQINVGGTKVAPSEVEAVLHTHPAVADAAVCGVPDALTGERVAAVVVPKAGGPWEPDQLASYCGPRLPAAAQPYMWVRATSVPRTDSGKILRGAVRTLVERAEAGVEC